MVVGDSRTVKKWLGQRAKGEEQSGKGQARQQDPRKRLRHTRLGERSEEQSGKGRHDNGTRVKGFATRGWGKERRAESKGQMRAIRLMTTDYGTAKQGPDCVIFCRQCRRFVPYCGWTGNTRSMSGHWRKPVPLVSFRGRLSNRSRRHGCKDVP